MCFCNFLPHPPPTQLCFWDVFILGYVNWLINFNHHMVFHCRDYSVYISIFLLRGSWDIYISPFFFLFFNHCRHSYKEHPSLVSVCKYRNWVCGSKKNHWVVRFVLLQVYQALPQCSSVDTPHTLMWEFLFLHLLNSWHCQTWRCLLICWMWNELSFWISFSFP